MPARKFPVAKAEFAGDNDNAAAPRAAAPASLLEDVLKLAIAAVAAGEPTPARMRRAAAAAAKTYDLFARLDDGE